MSARQKKLGLCQKFVKIAIWKIIQGDKLSVFVMQQVNVTSPNTYLSRGDADIFYICFEKGSIQNSCPVSYLVKLINTSFKRFSFVLSFLKRVSSILFSFLFDLLISMFQFLLKNPSNFLQLLPVINSIILKRREIDSRVVECECSYGVLFVSHYCYNSDYLNQFINIISYGEILISFLIVSSCLSSNNRQSSKIISFRISLLFSLPSSMLSLSRDCHPSSSRNRRSTCPQRLQSFGILGERLHLSEICLSSDTLGMRASRWGNWWEYPRRFLQVFWQFYRLCWVLFPFHRV